MEIAGEMEVDLFHRENLRVSAAGRTAFHAEAWTEGWLAKGYNGVFADLVESEGEAHRYGGLADTSLGCSDCGYQDELAVLCLGLVNQRNGYLCHIVAVLFDVFLVDADAFRDVGDLAHFYASCDFNVCLHVLP